MNILFLTLTKLSSIDDTMVYTDMLRVFSEKGHSVFAICPLEKRDKKEDYTEKKKNICLLHANISGNYFDTNVIKKGITLLTIEKDYINAIKKYFSETIFDFIIYTTPPITFNAVVKYVKERDNALSYLMLKDIFPQNAVDMCMIKEGGLLHHYFRNKEKALYNVSDYIGCMSRANIEYLLKHNTNIDPKAVELCPNSIIVRDMSLGETKKVEVRKKYGIPTGKTVFIYGGNLGKPQGIGFFVECLKRCERTNAYFIIIGNGTEKHLIEEYIRENKPVNIVLHNELPKEEYDLVVASCDVGLIFLDHRFTIPNFPSRMLSYMQARLPVLACTDPSTDIGTVIEEGNFGWWCESDEPNRFFECVLRIMEENLTDAGNNAYQYLERKYNVEDYVDRIVKKNHIRKTS